MIDFDKCINCSIFKAKESEILAKSNSAFDAAIDISDFVNNCKECEENENGKFEEDV